MRVARKKNLVFRVVGGGELDDSKLVRVVRKSNLMVRVVGGVEYDDSKSCALLEKRIWWFALLVESSLMTQPRAPC